MQQSGKLVQLLSRGEESRMKLAMSQKERVQLVTSALASAKEVGYPLKKKKNRLQLVQQSSRDRKKR